MSRKLTGFLTAHSDPGPEFLVSAAMNLNYQDGFKCPGVFQPPTKEWVPPARPMAFTVPIPSKYAVFSLQRSLDTEANTVFVNLTTGDVTSIGTWARCARRWRAQRRTTWTCRSLLQVSEGEMRDITLNRLLATPTPDEFDQDLNAVSTIGATSSPPGRQNPLDRDRCLLLCRQNLLSKPWR
ncbi:hypothetical protein C8R44DRAFT_747387 [Mycena epipterygia]|nr:hypothetical protein C8R44DRAFT_747387 [Mycena epipterygia]